MRIFFTFFVKKTVNTYGENLRVNFYTRLTSQTTLGNNVHFNGMIIRGSGKVTIGDNFHSGKEILIVNSYHKYDNGNAIPYDTKISISKDIRVEDNVWLGDRVTILGGVTIGEGAIIQAGAVVVSDIEKYGIAGGNPAKVFKSRDTKSYSKLKSEKKFC
jgi:acetyltransferase-like isoleucine patch superfamily enzyme